MGKVEPRAVTPVLSAIRNFLLGRSHTSPLRFGDYYAARTQPPPDVPGGPAHKLSNNYYYTRDGRREVAPPRVIINASGVKQISASAPQLGKEVSVSGLKVPGKQWKWD